MKASTFCEYASSEKSPTIAWKGLQNPTTFIYAILNYHRIKVANINHIIVTQAQFYNLAYVISYIFKHVLIEKWYLREGWKDKRVCGFGDTKGQYLWSQSN